MHPQLSSSEHDLQYTDVYPGYPGGFTIEIVGTTVFLPISAPPKNKILEQEVLL